MLAQRHELRRVDVEFLMGIMRMRTDRAEYVGKFLGDRQHLRQFSHARRDRHHAANTGGACARDNGVQLRREFRKIQMAVAVDEHRHAFAGLAGLGGFAGLADFSSSAVSGST